MRIIGLKAENIKKIKAVEIRPDTEEGLVIIAGANGQGKSSILDSIAYALGGKTLVPERPIRDGEKKASVVVDLGKYVVTRLFTEKGSSLKVESKDGAKYSNPQGLLDSIVGELSFDPLEFGRKKPKEQREILLGLVDLDIDLDVIADQRKELYLNRTIINRQVKQKFAELNGLDVPEVGLPTEKVSLSVLSGEYKKATETLAQNTQSRSRLEMFEENIIVETKEIVDLENRLNRTKTELSKTIESAEEQRIVVNSLLDPDLNDVDRRMQEAEALNSKIDAAQRFNAVKADHAAFLGNAADLSEGISSVDEQQFNAIKKANFHIDGLSVTDTCVIYKNVPFAQLSSSEKIKVSMGIGMAINPTFRVMMLSYGSMLDSNNVELIRALAKEKGYQFWMEIVDTSGKVGIVIEDGEIKNA